MKTAYIAPDANVIIINTAEDILQASTNALPELAWDNDGLDV